MNLKVNKISQILGISSIVFGLASFVRWFFVYPDKSTGMLYVFASFLVLWIAYVYHWMRMKDEDSKELHEALNRTNNRCFELEQKIGAQ